MPLNEGTTLEQEIITDLNEQKVGELTNNMHLFVRALFGALKLKETVYCAKVDGMMKADFVVTYMGKKRFVSMKSGHGDVVHNEVFSKFKDFLIENGISEHTIETIALFQFGDGTLDGTGIRRRPYHELMMELGPRIKEANKDLNKNKEFVLKVIDRCIFKGAYDDNQEADCIYCGNRDLGFVTTKKQIVTHIMRRNYDWMDNLHIGPLLLRPDSRYVDKDVKSVRNFQRIVVYWPRLKADLEYISRHYDY